MTRLEFVSSGVVDTFDDLPISLNYSIADIREPDKRRASFSKTINLPGTKNNNDKFKHIYEIDGESNFNPKIRARAVLSQDGIILIQGVMRLVNIIVNDQKIEYQVTIIGDSGGFFNAIEGLLLTDLDFSEFDRVLEINDIFAQWAAPVGEGIVSPIIDNGFNNGITWDLGTLYKSLPKS